MLGMADVCCSVIYEFFCVAIPISSKSALRMSKIRSAMFGVPNIQISHPNCWHFLAQSPSEEISSPSPVTAPEMLVGIS
jgi:hypothetical protein